MKKTIGLLAHVDAGKTTFSEQLLYHTETIKQRGRVDHQDAFLDSHPIEKQRGITIYADQATLHFNQSIYYVIDTPGHVDFSPEMERSIQVMDYAIIIISAVEGVQGHTETVWQLLKKHRVPTFFFINKVDRVGADKLRVIKDIQKNLTSDVYDFTTTFQDGDMTEELVEFLAERNELLLDIFMEEGYNKDQWMKALIAMVANNQVFPCFHGSALQDEGIIEFFTAFDRLTQTDYCNQGNFSGRVFKVRYDDNGTRIAFIKALQGQLQVRDEIRYGNKGNVKEEKVTGLRIYNGDTYETVNQVKAGEIVAVIGLSQANVGDGIGEWKDSSSYELIPTLKAKVIYDTSVSIKEMLRCFNILDAEDPSLQVQWDEHFQQIYIHVMGVIQLEVLQQLMKERFHYVVTFGKPEILYKETITSAVNGYGHFEPLKHYAEVHVELTPAKRNSGTTFKNVCHANDLSIGNQNLIRHHIFEREHHGLLTGSPLTDVSITLLTGRAHNKHTSGGDFREATYRAIRQGLEKAENVLLEPYYDFKIKVDTDHMGRVLSDIQQAHGTFAAPQMDEEKTIITGKVPVATFMNYSTELASFTQGKGIITRTFGGYDTCHNPTDVMEKIGYNKEADPLYTSTSIFCAKGQGYKVPWYEAEKQMHCL